MKCVTPNSRPSAKTTTLVFGIPAVLLLLLPLIKFDPNKASSSLGALAHFVGRLFQAPDQKFLPTLFQLTGESLLIAFVAVMIAIAISFPISILAARNWNTGSWDCLDIPRDS
jgi:ABC-type phosphate/phosphonate transport system permease subunit